MRILHIVTDMRISNGIMSVVLNYFRAMPDDIKFDILYFKEFEGNRKADIEKLGGRVFKINKPGIKSFAKSDIDEFLNQHKDEFEAAHIHAPHLACLFVPKLRKYGIKKIAVHCHSTCFSMNPRNVKRNHMLSIPVKYMRVKRIACGQAAGEFWYGKHGDFKVLPNAIRCTDFRFNIKEREKKREELGLGEKFIIGHIGITNPPLKNHRFLFRIADVIINKYKKNAELMLVGADEDEGLVSLAKELGIYNNIRFMGQRRDIPQLLQAMDVFVFPSIREGLPLSVVEAQAAGLPVVMSEAVSDEVCCTDKIVRMSLEESPEKWADTVLKYADKGVGDTYSMMKKSNWDINDTAKTLENFYRTGVIK